MGMSSNVIIEYGYFVLGVWYYYIYMYWKHCNDILDCIEYGWNASSLLNHSYGVGGLFQLFVPFSFVLFYHSVY